MNNLRPGLMDFQQPTARQTRKPCSLPPAGFALLSPVGDVLRRLFTRASKQAETIGPVRDRLDRAAFSEREQERRAFWLLMASIVAMCAVMSLVTRSSRPAATGTLNDRPALAVGNGTDAAGNISGRLDLMEKRLDRMEREQRSANSAWLAIWQRIDRKLPDYRDSGLRLPGIKGQVKQ